MLLACLLAAVTVESRPLVGNPAPEFKAVAVYNDQFKEVRSTADVPAVGTTDSVRRVRVNRTTACSIEKTLYLLSLKMQQVAL